MAFGQTADVFASRHAQFSEFEEHDGKPNDKEREQD